MSKTKHSKKRNIKSKRKQSKLKRSQRNPSRKIKHKKTKRTKAKKIKIKSYNPKRLPITKNQMLLFHGLQKTGANKIYGKDWMAKNKRPRVMEYSGFLDFDKDGLEKVIVDDRAVALDENEATSYSSYPIYSPRMYDYNDDYEFNFHTHPGMRWTDSLIEEVHVGDINFYIENAKSKNKTQGELVFAPEGIYGIFPTKTPKDIKYIPHNLEGSLHFLEQKHVNKFETIYKNKVRIAAAKSLNLSPDNFRPSKLIKNLEKEIIKNKNNKSKTFELQESYNKLYRHLNNAIYSIVSPKIKTELIPKINKIYEKYNVYIDFFPVIYDSDTSSWKYPQLNVPVSYIEGFVSNKKNDENKAMHNKKIFADKV